jgi:hypothetical protein
MRAGSVLILACLSAGGCTSVNNFWNNVTGGAQPQQVTPDQFVQQGPQPQPSGIDQAGELNPQNPRLEATFHPALPAQSTAVPRTDTHISSAISSNIQTPELTHQAQAATQPAAQPPAQASLASGQYMPLGGVVAEVNGTPIFVNKVLQMVGPTLRNDARTMDEDHFELAARDEIEREIGFLESDELEFAAAERNLDDSDKRFVTDLTAQYRLQLVTQSGGSEEVARRKAAANGDDFDELLRDRYRAFMIQVYYQRKYLPLAEPGARDMRDYYAAHVQKDFSEPSEAVFDLIKIDPAQEHSDSSVEDKQLAYQQAKLAHDRAVAGTNFATLFAEFNNDPGLRILTNGTGNMGVMQRGSFNIPQIEDAVWSLQPGQTTDVIEVDGVLYIAKLESRKIGVVRPFEDEEVQTRIYNEIRRQRIADLREDELRRLRADSITTEYPAMMQTALDIALQNYKTWNAK